MTWQTIEAAPTDGTLVRLKRQCRGRPIEGEGYFGHLHKNAPSRSGMGLDPLGRLSAADYVKEASDRAAFVAEPKWLREGGMYLFPTPTHWAPLDNGELSNDKEPT